MTTLTEKLEKQEALPVFRATLIRTDALLTLPRWGKVKNNPTADVLRRSNINRNKAPFMSFLTEKNLTTLPFNVTASATFLWSKKVEPCMGASE